MIYETDEQLQHDLRFWIEVLKLTEWQIVAKLVDETSLMDSAVARVRVTKNTKQAKILIATERVYRDLFDADTFPLDHQGTLVHELLHCVMEDLKPEDDSSLEYVRFEQIIECLARSFASLQASVQSGM